MLLRHNGCVRVSGGFCLVTAWFGLVNGWRLLGIVLGASGVHELGHYLALRLLGASCGRLRLGVLGAVLERAALLRQGACLRLGRAGGQSPVRAAADRGRTGSVGGYDRGQSGTVRL